MPDLSPEEEDRFLWAVAKHKDQQKPRPLYEGSILESHHGVNSKWMEANFPGIYHEDEAPTILIPKELHIAMHRSPNTEFRRDIARRQGVSGVKNIDWSKISPGEMWMLSEKQFQTAKIPREHVNEYFKQFNQYHEHLIERKRQDTSISRETIAGVSDSKSHTAEKSSAHAEHSSLQSGATVTATAPISTETTSDAKSQANIGPRDQPQQVPQGKGQTSANKQSEDFGGNATGQANNQDQLKARPQGLVKGEGSTSTQPRAPNIQDTNQQKSEAERVERANRESEAKKQIDRSEATTQSRTARDSESASVGKENPRQPRESSHSGSKTNTLGKQQAQPSKTGGNTSETKQSKESDIRQAELTSAPNRGKATTSLDQAKDTGKGSGQGAQSNTQAQEKTPAAPRTPKNLNAEEKSKQLNGEPKQAQGQSFPSQSAAQKTADLRKAKTSTHDADHTTRQEKASQQALNSSSTQATTMKQPSSASQSDQTKELRSSSKQQGQDASTASKSTTQTSTASGITSQQPSQSSGASPGQGGGGQGRGR